MKKKVTAYRPIRYSLCEKNSSRK